MVSLVATCAPGICSNRAKAIPARTASQAATRVSQWRKGVANLGRLGAPPTSFASDLGVVEQTVKVHRARIMQKVGTTSVAELVRLTERLAALRG